MIGIMDESNHFIYVCKCRVWAVRAAENKTYRNETVSVAWMEGSHWIFYKCSNLCAVEVFVFLSVSWLHSYSWNDSNSTYQNLHMKIIGGMRLWIKIGLFNYSQVWPNIKIASSTWIVISIKKTFWQSEKVRLPVHLRNIYLE